MYRTIVAPMDGSKLAECTLDEVRRVAGDKTQVVLVSVVESVRGKLKVQLSPELQRDMGISPKMADNSYEAPTIFFDDIGANEIIAEAEAKNEDSLRTYLARVGGRLKKQGLNVKAEILHGKPAEEIVNFAESAKADLIVVSTHGRSGPSRWAFGSVADKVMRMARMPVLMVTPVSCRLPEA